MKHKILASVIHCRREHAGMGIKAEYINRLYVFQKVEEMSVELHVGDKKHLEV